MFKNISIGLLLLISINFTSGQTSPFQMVQNMGRGINLGNTLSAPIEGNWAPPVEQSYFQDIAALGFKTVRIPIRFDNQTTALSSVTYEDASGNYIGSVSDYTVNSTYLDRIEEVTDWALAEGLIAIVDAHGDHWYWGSYNSESSDYKSGNDRLAAEDRFKAIWTAIANRFQNKSENLLFEIMNEAYFDMTNAEVETTYNFILPIIRANNPTRNVIVTGGGDNSWKAPLQLTSSFINSDSYLIATFHYYIPFNFTSSSRPDKNDFDWGTASDKNNVDTHFNNVQNWATTNNMAVLLGEFGADNTNGYDYFNGVESTDGGPDNASRVEYHNYISQAALDRGFSFTVWDAGEKANKTIFRFTNRQWVKDIRHTLLDPSCTENDLFKNENIECGYDWNWSLKISEVAEAYLYTASLAEGRNNTQSSKIEVTTATGSIESVILENEEIETATLSNKDYEVSCFAKGTNTNQKFRMRLKATVNGTTQFLFSPKFNMTTSYTEFTHVFSIPENTTNVQFQVLVGEFSGVYFFDDFQAQDTDSLFVNTLEKGVVKIYPNPLATTLYFQSEAVINAIILTDLLGKSQSFEIENNQFQVPKNYANGLYYMQILTANGERLTHKKILVNRDK